MVCACLSSRCPQYKYHEELEGFNFGPWRLHIRYLLIDFLGQVKQPDDKEVLLLGDWLNSSKDGLRVLISIRGNEDWFKALYRSHFPIVMRWPVDRVWPMLGVLTGAW